MFFLFQPTRTVFKRTTTFHSCSTTTRQNHTTGNDKRLSLSLFCSDMDESVRWSQLFQKLFDSKSTLLPPNTSGNVIHLVNHGNTQIELVSNSMYSRIRNAMGYPRFTHLIHVGTGSTSGHYCPPLTSSLRKEHSIPQTQFIGRSSSSSSSSSSSTTLNMESLVRGVKEIIIPSMPSFGHAEKIEYELGAVALESLVNVYALDMGMGQDKVYLRTAPTDRCQVVLKVNDLSVAMEQLNGLDIIFERIGANGMTGQSSGGQIKLRTSASSFGEFDLRMTDSDAQPAPFFVEGEESVLQGAILGIQNPRVLGCDTATIKTTPSKDCWMEVRAMIRS